MTDSHDLAATYTDSAIRIEVPRSLARDWTETDRVGISAQQPAGNGTSLQILIEKDFKCIHQDSEGGEDAYPNPLQRQPT